MIDFLNCPNCGAPITSDRCEYCGTVFYDWATIDTDKASFIKIKHGDRYVWLKVMMDDISIRTDVNELAYYADNEVYNLVRSPTCYRISANFHTVPFDLHNSDGPYGPRTLAAIVKRIEKGQTYDRSYC